MTNAFEKRRTRLRAMKELFGHYLPPDQLISCPRCGQEHPRSEVEANLSVCTMCGYHWPLNGAQRLAMVMDRGRWRALNADVSAADPLAFPGYGEKLRQVQERTGLREAEVTAVGSIHGYRCVVCVLDSRFLMGSMSAAVGEKITLAIEYAQRRRLPLIIFSASGGARMQEGILSLMQMAKTSAALKRFSDREVAYISVLTDPTTDGVTASFASLGDVILAEPGALIGFAGPRVIEQTIGEKLRDALGELLMLHEKGVNHD